MQLATPDLAIAARSVAQAAFARAGGPGLARRAETDPSLRAGEVARTVASVGIESLRPGNEVDDLIGAIEVCAAAGAVALPYPIVGRLAAPPGRAALVVLSGLHGRADHADLLGDAVGVDLDGGVERRVDRATSVRLGRLGPFVGDVTLGEAIAAEARPGRDAALWLLLGASWIYGAIESALEMTIAHVSVREQFGAPLAKLQSVRFRLADAAVAVRGLRELVLYTAWRFHQAPADAITDALAVRIAAQESAHLTMRTAHQLHGAIGFCDEHDLSIVSRHLQPYLRLPFDHEETVARFSAAVARDGFDGLFGRFR